MLIYIVCCEINRTDETYELVTGELSCRLMTDSWSMIRHSKPNLLWNSDLISSKTDVHSAKSVLLCHLFNLPYHLTINKSTFSYRSTMALSCFLYRFKFPMFGWFGQIPKNIQSWKLLDCWHFLLLTNCIQKSPWSRINLVNPSKKFFFFLSVALK